MNKKITKLLNREVKTKEEARQQAIDFQYAFSDTKGITYSDLAFYGEHFTKTGKKFGLIREFKENGII